MNNIEKLKLLYGSNLKQRFHDDDRIYFLETDRGNKVVLEKFIVDIEDLQILLRINNDIIVCSSGETYRMKRSVIINIQSKKVLKADMCETIHESENYKLLGIVIAGKNRKNVAVYDNNLKRICRHTAKEDITMISAPFFEGGKGEIRLHQGINVEGLYINFNKKG